MTTPHTPTAPATAIEAQPFPSSHVATSAFPSGRDRPDWWPLATSLLDEHDNALRIEGTVPSGLSGTLYRNGPGRFDRGDLRKNHLLDGDGMVQAFNIADGQIRYRNRFVRTAKYVEESEADRFLHDTWTTRRPDAMPTDPPRIENQAGVTVVPRGDSLYALDDGPGICELDPVSLATRGPASLDLPDGVSPLITAHTNLDPTSGNWTLVSGSGDKQQVVTLDRSGRCVQHLDVALPRPVWLHDFLMTDRHIVFICHPLHIDLERFLGGGYSIWDSFNWNPDAGNLVVVADRNGDASPRVFETETAFSWHGLNAFTDGNEVVVDYVGYLDADHAFGADPQLRAAAVGRPGDGDGLGTVRRLRLSTHTGNAAETVYDHGGHEFPHVNPHRRNTAHRFGYFATTKPGEAVLPSGVARIDMNTGEREAFEFGPGEYCIEPIFATNPDTQSSGNREPGWLMTIVNNGATGHACLAIFDAESLSNGPVAKAHLKHHTPFSFHGYWSPTP